MDGLVKSIEKLQPAFRKIAQNRYLRSIRDGFISLMPIIIFSSIFMLVAYVPNIWGYHWPAGVETALVKAYNYSMGILAFIAAGTVAKALTSILNLELSKTNQIPETAVMYSAQIAFLLMVADPITLKSGLAFFAGFLGSKGLITAFLVAFIVPNIYYFCFKNHITIKLPDVVPQNISEAFQNIFPFGFSLLFFWLLDIGFRAATGTNLAEWIIQILSPIFTAADGYTGLAIIYGLMAFFWFVGIQGPSIIEPAVVAIYLANAEANLHMYQAGHQATRVLTYGLQQGVATMGGTGATLVLVYMFAFMAKSKQNKAVGRASFIPVTFGVNEPLLFGAPLILNPTFFIPFVVTPIVNVWLFKFCVDVLHMNSFMYNLPWTTPGPLYIFLGTGFSIIALVFAIVILGIDFLIYYPFFKAYDASMVAQEDKIEDKEEAVELAEDGEKSKDVSHETPKEVAKEEKAISTDLNYDLNKTKDHKKLNVLVLCAGGGTSGILAKSINKLAEDKNLPVEAAATAYGNHSQLLKGMDVVVLAPQMESMKDELQKEADHDDAVMITTTGRQYIGMTRNAPEALKYIIDKLKSKEDAKQ